jgi:hypothetical protein
MIPLIRATNHNAYHSGEWARIRGLVVVNPLAEPAGKPSQLGSRICYEVEFINGDIDTWPIEDLSAGYEFQPTIHDGKGCAYMIRVNQPHSGQSDPGAADAQG